MKKFANRADRVKFKGIQTKANYHSQIIRFTVFVVSFYLKVFEHKESFRDTDIRSVGVKKQMGQYSQVVFK